jgi:superoxide reductase
MTCCGSDTEVLGENLIHEEALNHKPIIRKIGNFVTISVDRSHPMVDVHHISFICMETNKGFQYKKLLLETNVKADFILANDEEIINVYMYCNIHQLWNLEVE